MKGPAAAGSSPASGREVRPCATVQSERRSAVEEGANETRVAAVIHSTEAVLVQLSALAGPQGTGALR